MKNEKLFIYYSSVQEKQAELLLKQIQSFGLDSAYININVNKSDLEIVNELTEISKDVFPILRIGEQKIRAVLQSPKLELLQKLFTNDLVEYKLPQPTIYSTNWCGDCRQLKMWMNSQEIVYNEILIEDSEELKEQITRWSGGRRVIPTVNYESIGRLFNPGIAVFQKIYKQT